MTTMTGGISRSEMSTMAALLPSTFPFPPSPPRPSERRRLLAGLVVVGLSGLGGLGLLGVLGLRGIRAGAGAGRATAVDEHHVPLDHDAHRIDGDEAARALEG